MPDWWHTSASYRHFSPTGSTGVAVHYVRYALGVPGTRRLLVLAPGAKVGAAVTYLGALYGRAAVIAHLATPVGHPELEMGRTQLTTRPVVVDDARPLLTDSLPQHLPDGATQSFHLVRRQAYRPAAAGESRR